MNYLAHAYLSFGHPAILTGNMISDFVKGKKKFSYSVEIQKGIALHRCIDAFTDSHEITREAMSYFKNAYRLYSGAFVDVLYDHFLARDEKIFGNEGLLFDFSQSTYSILENNLEALPPNFQQVFPYMKQHNWLYHYRQREGIEKAFAGLVRRAAYLSESITAYTIFNEQYTALSDCYEAFFPELADYTLKQLSELNNA